MAIGYSVFFHVQVQDTGSSEKVGTPQGTPYARSPEPRTNPDRPTEETAYESYMNPEPGFQSGPGDYVDAD